MRNLRRRVKTCPIALTGKFEDGLRFHPTRRPAPRAHVLRLDCRASRDGFIAPRNASARE